VEAKRELNIFLMNKIWILLLLLITSCTAKKNLTTVDIERERISYVLPTDNRLYVEALCDSLGNPVQIERVITDATGTTTLKIKDNKLEIITKHDTIFKDKYVYKDKLVKSEIVRTKTDWRLILFFCLAILIFVIFPKIPRAINTIVIKLIRGF